ncbi:MAG TPA: AAA family ATPase, partial [Noviherbaspirillum sp.]|nr:AAA family ATPase [Noviherbaspirillum sp.]
MRFQRLDLLKYGKFTGRSIEFPVSTRDFHLIVGPNEAGKSTTRSAILDLLFGIPARSAMAFLHPLNELRLGASIANKVDSLEFHRAKAQKQTIRTPADSVLPDNTLVPYLGTADRNFFDQMFGLDHGRLVAGGNSILNAENDVGQVLFQSAAGIASLGKIRDALLAEADKLWAPKKAAARAYYSAAELLEKANATLKETTVRPKVWAEANSRLESIIEELDTVSKQLRQLEIDRNRLERVRRVAPFLHAVRDIEHQLTELGTVVELPADAASTLATATQRLATAEKLLELHRSEAERTNQELASIHIDSAILDLAADITRLEECRLRYSAHEHDIGRREEEVRALLADIRKACAQLGWDFDSDEALKAQLPSLLVRRELSRLSRTQSGLAQTLRAAEQAEEAKAAEIRQLSQDLEEVHAREVSPALRIALNSARTIGDPEPTLLKHESELAKAKAALADAEAALGKWNMPIGELAALQLPGQDGLLQVTQDRNTLVADRRALGKRIQEQAEAVSLIELKIAQIKDRHLPTPPEAVAQSRQERNAAWSTIKEGAVSPQQGAEEFEAKVRHADELVDKRLENVEVAAALQNQQHQLQQAMLQQSMLGEQLSRLKEEIAQFDKIWDETATAIGLPGMRLDDIGDWIAKREKVLIAATECKDAQDRADMVARTVNEATKALTKALCDAGQHALETDALPVLCVQAENHIRSMEAASVRRETLQGQLKAAQLQIQALGQVTAAARGEIDRWQQEWLSALENAGLAHECTIGMVEGALELIAQIEEQLEKVRQIRVERIDTMKADLEGFAEQAYRLSRQFGRDFDGSSPELIARELVKRLAIAKDAHAEASRLKEALRTAEAEVRRSQEAIEAANASLTPLMERAGTSSLAALSEAIASSDARRQLLSALNTAKKQLSDGGDGLSREQLESEVNALDLSQLTAELDHTTKEHAAAVQRQATLFAEKEKANSVLQAISGSETAAVAEAKRQEALAAMADAAERYVKVYTAGRLLRWSIDRYREEKQGPLLGRAGAIFAKLTQGGFQRLVVDFEAEPMALEGQRADGKLVPISGMSDGTRDQLYLALRLAALELHLDQAPPLPFIADDLFIN